MDYEKKYKEVIKRAEAALKVAQNKKEVWDCIVTILPELKENEDEKIRKGIIRNLKYLADKAQGFVKDELEERIAWLESLKYRVQTLAKIEKGIK